MPLVSSARLDQIFDDRKRDRTIDPRDVLFERARILPPRDRVMLEMAFRNHLTLRQISVIMEQPAGTISRRLARLCARLRDPLVASLLEPECAIKGKYREIAIGYFARGMRFGDLSKQHLISHSEVRRIVSFVRGWHRGVHKQMEIPENAVV